MYCICLICTQENLKWNDREQVVCLVLASEEGGQLIHRHDGEAGAQHPVQNRFPARELLSHGQQVLYRQAAQAFHHVRLTARRFTNIRDCNFLYQSSQLAFFCKFYYVKKQLADLEHFVRIRV